MIMAWVGSGQSEERFAFRDRQFSGGVTVFRTAAASGRVVDLLRQPLLAPFASAICLCICSPGFFGRGGRRLCILRLFLCFFPTVFLFEIVSTLTSSFLLVLDNLAVDDLVDTTCQNGWIARIRIEPMITCYTFRDAISISFVFGFFGHLGRLDLLDLLGLFPPLPPLISFLGAPQPHEARRCYCVAGAQQRCQVHIKRAVGSWRIQKQAHGAHARSHAHGGSPGLCL